MENLSPPSSQDRGDSFLSGPWSEVQRISDKEMRLLMLQVEKQLALCLQVICNVQREGVLEELVARMRQEYFGENGVSWDIPKEKWNERKNRKESG